MPAPLYTTDILRLAASNPYHGRLADAAGSSEQRSPICGSRVIVDLTMDADARVAAIGMQVEACAFGQAAATVLARCAIGRSAEELAGARDALARWIDGAGDRPDWPGLEHFRAPGLDAARKASVQLAFRAAAAAASVAAAARAACPA